MKKSCKYMIQTRDSTDRRTKWYNFYDNDSTSLKDTIGDVKRIECGGTDIRIIKNCDNKKEIIKEYLDET